MDTEKLNKEIREAWFKDHIVRDHVRSNMIDGRKMERMVWARPDSSIYRVDYIRVGGVLHVSGDLGFASYVWDYWGDSNIDLAWIGHCDVGYFASKCQASEAGRDFRLWDPATLRRRLDQLFSDPDMFESEERCEEIRANLEESMGYGADDYMSSDRDWYRWCWEHAQDIFGDCWWELIPEGWVLHPRCRAHHMGLRMYAELMDNQEEQADERQTCESPA